VKWSQNFLWIGILCIISGIIIVAAGNSVWENSTFFIFPFFVFSGSDPISIFFVLGFMLVIVLLMLRTINQTSLGGNLHVGGKCAICSAPLPEGASFCSNCGNAIDDSYMENE
jgi:hypothetical protein